MTVDFQPRQGADIDIFGISRACVHTEPAAHDHALAVLAHPLDRDPFPGIGAEALTDDRRAAAKGQEPAGAGHPVAVGHRVGDISKTGVTGLRGGQDSQCDQMTVQRSVGDVAGAKEYRRLDRLSNRDHVLAGFRSHKCPGHALSARIGWRQQSVGPDRIEMPVVPGDVLLDHGLCRGVSGHVVDASLAHHKDLAPISECFAIFSANSHDKPIGYVG